MTDNTPTAARLINPSDASPISWDQAAQQLVEARTFWLATACPDGRPHVRPILAVWADDALHFVSSTSTRKWRDLERASYCSVSTITDGIDLVLEGEAVRVTDDARLQRVARAYDSKYQWPVEIRDGAFHAEGAPTAGPPPFHVFELQPTSVFGFGTDEAFADRSTRWRF
jgi:uncharacterized pyridoxamine 5'-phosphate oxidase family protein